MENIGSFRYLECYAASKCHVARHGEVIKFQHVRNAGKAGEKFMHLSSLHNRHNSTLCVIFRLFISYNDTAMIH